MRCDNPDTHRGRERENKNKQTVGDWIGLTLKNGREGEGKGNMVTNSNNMGWWWWWYMGDAADWMRLDWNGSGLRLDWIGMGVD